MIRTRVGYCGGEAENPTYRSMGDHTEAISIDYDPEILSYQDLLAYFWKGHRCTAVNRSVQYQNAIFYRNEEQRLAAVNSLSGTALAQQVPEGQISTQIRPLRTFTYAEGYHHKYYLNRTKPVREFLVKIYPDAKELADSTVSTRLNAFLGAGMDLDWTLFLEELPSYGLPPEMKENLRTLAERRRINQ